MTFSEVKLWEILNNGKMMEYDFDRQKPVGNYIVDFYCKDLMLAIEVDGITHSEGSGYACRILLQSTHPRSSREGMRSLFLHNMNFLEASSITDLMTSHSPSPFKEGSKGCIEACFKRSLCKCKQAKKYLSNQVKHHIPS
jgi:hypothetical protein